MNNVKEPLSFEELTALVNGDSSPKTKKAKKAPKPQPSKEFLEEDFFGAGEAQETDNIEDAIKAYHLDWQAVKVKDIFTRSDNPEFDGLQFFNNVGIIRSDTKYPLAIMGNRYEPIQNKQILDIFSDILSTRQLTFTHGGALAGGRRIWIAAKLPDEMEVSDTTILRYLIISWSHDGTETLTISFTPYLAKMKVALSSFVPGVKSFYQIRHTKNAKTRIATTSNLMKDAVAYFDHANQLLQDMADRSCSMNRFKDMMELIYPDPSAPKVDDDGNVITSANEKTRGKITSVWSGLDRSIKHSDFGALVAVCKYADQERSTRVTKINKTEGEARLTSTLFGSANKMKLNAAQKIFDFEALAAAAEKASIAF